MKYFIDTEFIEGLHKPIFGKKRHFIDLISIGIVDENGRSYYAISNEYKFEDANKWVQDNVIIPMYRQEISGDRRNHMNAETFHKYTNKSFSNDRIAEDIRRFCQSNVYGEPQFYGYYADYDWVVFCSLFGRMLDLPKGFPMYCRDLKQMLDESYIYQENKYDGETRLDSWLKQVKNHPDYPKQKDEHNALADAKWNKELYDFITQKKFLNKPESQPAKTIDHV